MGAIIEAIIEACEEAGEQWAIDVWHELPEVRARVNWWPGDVGDGALLTAQHAARHAGAHWCEIDSGARSDAIDAVLRGARVTWARLEAHS